MALQEVKVPDKKNKVSTLEMAAKFLDIGTSLGNLAFGFSKMKGPKTPKVTPKASASQLPGTIRT